MTAETYGVHIAGVGRPGRGRETDLIDPSSGTPFARLAEATAADLDQAVEAADGAFRRSGWKDMAPLRREEIIQNAVRMIRDRAGEIARLETRNIGRPLRETLRNVRLAADTFAFYAALTTHVRGATVPMGPGLFDYTVREPIGVCGVIVPWNNPVDLFARKVAPALAAGNAVVAKPASLSPVSALLIAEIFAEAGLPAGLLNVLPGPGPEVGGALAAHPGVGKVAFTGATATGRGVLHAAADRVAKVSLELGGKSAAVVFPDADLDAAAAGCVAAMFPNAGQTCTARSRVLVHEDVHAEFLARFARLAGELTVGHPLAEATDIGPVISARQRDVVLGFIDRAVGDGAEAVTGGGPARVDGWEGGFYVRPTILAGAARDSEVVREEVFGPVVVTAPFTTEREAIDVANDSPYGLAATVWTGDVSRALRLTAALDAGTVTVNTAKVSHVYAPFGGFKQSGLGSELGVEGLEEYLRTKNVVVGVPATG